MNPHAPVLAYSSGARADHKVEFSVEDRLDQARDRLRPVAAVAIEKNQDLGLALGRHCHTPGTGPAIATLLLDDDSGPRRAGYGDRAVAAAAINDDDLVHPLPRDRGNHRPDRSFLLKDRDNRGDAGPFGQWAAD